MKTDESTFDPVIWSETRLYQAVGELTVALRDAQAGDIVRALDAAEYACRLLKDAKGWRDSAKTGPIIP